MALLKGKLIALLKCAQLNERSSQAEFQRVKAIFDERNAICAKLKQLETELQTGARDTLKIGIRSGLFQGQPHAIGRSVSYEKRLVKEIKDVRKKLIDREKEFERSVNELTLARAELIESRLETKRLDKIISREKLKEQILSIAREEIFLEEISNVK